MKQRDGAVPSMAHGFFHTMVVMGGALALGCGGESRSLTDAPQPGTAGMNTDGAGGGAGHGGMASSGAGNAAIAGGPGSAGGGAGGSTTISFGGMAGAAVIPNCPPTQWSCQNAVCGNVDLSNPIGCSCDTARPKTPADCGGDGSMACYDGAEYDASGNLVQPNVPFECECIPRQTNCTTACMIFETGSVSGPNLTRCENADPYSDVNPNEPILCGCAPVVLK